MKKVTIILLFLTLSISFLLIIPKVILARNKAQTKKVNSAFIPTPTKIRKIQVTPTLNFKISPTLTPTPTKKLVLTPTKAILPSPSPSRVTTATPLPPSPQPASLSTIQEFLLSEVNAYRSSKGLSAVKSDSNTCSFAQTRAQEITSNFSHDGFSSRIDSKTLPYPSYHEVTENIAMTSDYKQVVKMWINSSGHAANMEKDTPFVCIASSGNYYAYEGWKP